MKQETDDDLIHKAQAGDRAAFAALVRRHYGFMFKVAWKLCGNREQAEDIAQDSAIRLAAALGRFRFESAFTTWLYRLVLNMTRDHQRASGRQNSREMPLYEDVVQASAAPTPEEQMQQKDMLRALAVLPAALRETVVLVCWQGLSHKEAAVALDCSEGTISWRIHEARKKISTFLDGVERGVVKLKSLLWSFALLVIAEVCHG